MKKKILLVFIFIFSFCLLACNKQEETKKPTETIEEPTKTVEVIEYSISYDLDGGECNELVEKFKENEKVLLPTPTKVGYNFVGWFDGDTQIESVGNQNYSLKAKWEIKQLKIKVYNGDELIDSLKINYNEALDTNKYIEKGLKFISADKDVNNITEDGDIKCTFEVLTNAIVFIYKEDKITCKAINTEYIGLQIEFEADNECSIKAFSTLASTNSNDNVYKYIYSNKDNATGINDLFEVDGLVDISNVVLKGYYYNSEKQLIELELTSVIIK